MKTVTLKMNIPFGGKVQTVLNRLADNGVKYEWNVMTGALTVKTTEDKLPEVFAEFSEID